MENLPNDEIPNMIIGYLNRKALLSVRLVNKTWQTSAENHLRKVAHVSLEIDKDVSDLIRITSWRNKNTIPPFIKFNISGVLSKGILEELGRKYGNVIKSLRFELKSVRPEGYPPYPTIDNSNMFELLMKTPNINEIYVVNYWNDVDMKREYQLCLPKLRILELERMDTNSVKLIFNSAPNIQQVKLGEHKGEITEDNWRDHITIFQSIATRGIQLKLGIWISSDNVNLQKLKEIVKIPFKVTELDLTVGGNFVASEDWSLVQESIEEFIHKHSTTLKLLLVRRYLGHTEHLWKLNLKNLENLEQLKLHSAGIKETNFQVNLEQTPMLKDVGIESAELNMESAPLLIHLSIRTNNLSKYLKRPELFDVIVRLERLCLDFREETPTTTEADERVQLLNKFLSQAKNLKVLEIETNNSTGMDELQLPIMKNLLTLILLNISFGINGKIKLQQSNFPQLKFLELDTSLYGNPSLNESLESVRTLILESESLLKFKNTVLRFPMLKTLHLVGIAAGFLPFVFKNIPHLEELKIHSSSGVTWDELTGNAEVVDFVGEPSARNLDTSIPNLGDLIDLKRLHIANAWMDEVKAISYLISCGKLKNLIFFEPFVNRLGTPARFTELEQQKLISYVNIIEFNNTRTNITPFPYELKM